MSPKRKVVRRPMHPVQMAAPSVPASVSTAAALQRFNSRRRRRAVAVALFVLGPVIAVSHILEHLGSFELMRPAMEDVFIGWPTAFVLVIIGGILWG